MLLELFHKVSAPPQGIYTAVLKLVQGVSH